MTRDVKNIFNLPDYDVTTVTITVTSFQQMTTGFDILPF